MQPHKNISTMGKMMILEGSILLVPLFILIFYRTEGNLAWQFILPALASVVLGIVLGVCQKKKPSSSQIVVFAWLYGFFLAAIPFWLYGNVTFVQALFESVSGFTTTGLSVLNVEETPHIFLFYRAFLQYVGGLGFVIMILLFIQEKEAATLYQAEGHPDKIMPNIGKTAKVIGLMYSAFLLIGTVLYVMFGMGLFDSVVHTMCALSTGGFSNRLDSIGAYHSLPIEWVTILLMLIGTTNFSLLLLLCRGRWKAFVKASEIRFLAAVTAISVPFMTLFLMKDGTAFGTSLEMSCFNAFSALSTTGYSTSGYGDWPQTALALMILLMIIGGGIGSTAGGIKLGRVCRLMKNLAWNIRKKLGSEHAVRLMYYTGSNGREILERDQVEDDTTYAHTYLLLFVIGTVALTYFSGCTLIEGAFEFASSIGTVGLSIGVTSAETSAICLIIEMLGMILGRLEIFVLLQTICKK